jgi:hypothetical protein
MLITIFGYASGRCGAQFPCPGGTEFVMHDLWIGTTVKHASVPIFQLQ